MPKAVNLKAKSEWVELKASAADWNDLDPDLGRTMLAQLHLIRAFEEKVLEFAGQGLVHGPAHSAIGQEGGAVGSALAMRPSDQVNGSHRAHHQFLAKSMSYLEPDGISAKSAYPGSVRTLAKRTLSEIAGLAEGFCKGRGGSMHLRWAEAGNLGTNAIVGGAVPSAAGAAWAHKRAGSGDVVYTYFGDGATNIGSTLETMNLAAAWKLPICFFIENNQYAVSTTLEESTAETRLSARGLGFAIPSFRVDGMDPLAVYLACQQANEIMRAGEGPVIIEADLYRYFHQSGVLPGSAFGYRSKQEEEAWKKRDPLEQLAAQLQKRQIVGQSDIDKVRKNAQDLMNSVAGELIEEVDGQRRIVPALWPKPEFRDFGIRGDLSEFNGVRFEEFETFRGALSEERTFIQTIAAVMKQRMSQDERIINMGEDIHQLNGGTHGATRGLRDLFPDRILPTPICENAFAGLSCGIAADGRYVPVMEFMFPDFIWVAADQIFNQIGKYRHMFGGDTDLPLVLRTKVSMGAGYGSQHSMDPAGLFATAPGWRIVAPSTPFDYIGLMNSALLCRDPVLMIEHVDLYKQKGLTPTDDLDFYIPLGKAKRVREGKDLTILTYLSMVGLSGEIASDLGIDAEIIDLRSLDQAGLDWQTIEASVRKTGNVVIVEQGPIGPSYGGMLANKVQERCFDWLDQPVKRVHGGEASPSISKVLEASTLAGAAEIEVTLRAMMADTGRTL
ncbi:MAG: MFS transporter [Hyphomicrobiaceae bacterium]|nr:MFS transporter [Hyphomicrobiaceae bacterium]